ncbi:MULTISPECIES: hypothetical protein [unclassified Salipiger]|uniref:hypothetical protein n=1 Tax=unclassified Salipiger TaxID=2640570 RepID=UPI0013BB2293|nr:MULTISPECIES: hypothetical protein [unclassified Salipiger]NDV52557.1 hypothetical protein [Salipiger sp. PrR003]NDW32726.1 hypothetical protein [Salipiger sp. PrR007]
MDRLALYLTMMSWTVISGAFIIVLLSFGVFSFWWIVGAAGVALLLAWPVSFLISRRIKARDKSWKVEKEPSVIPKPGRPEL